MNIGARISLLRSTKGLTVNKLANMAGISQSYLRDLELGNNNNPSIEVLEYLCTALGITLKDFFDTEGSSCLTEDLLIKEIYQLSPTQREYLRAFLSSMKN